MIGRLPPTQSRLDPPPDPTIGPCSRVALTVPDVQISSFPFFIGEFCSRSCSGARFRLSAEDDALRVHQRSPTALRVADNDRQRQLKAALRCAGFIESEDWIASMGFYTLSAWSLARPRRSVVNVLRRIRVRPRPIYCYSETVHLRFPSVLPSLYWRRLNSLTLTGRPARGRPGPPDLGRHRVRIFQAA
jgi:hypothetical protein